MCVRGVYYVSVWLICLNKCPKNATLPLLLPCLHSCQSQSGALCPNLKLNRTHFLLVFALVCNSRTEVCLCVCVCRPLVMSLSVIVMQTMPGRRQAGSQSVLVNLLLPPGGVLPLFGSCISFTFSMSLRSFSFPPSLSLSRADIRNLPLQINCQVMAVTSLLPPPLSPPSLLPLFFSLLTRVSMR